VQHPPRHADESDHAGELSSLAVGLGKCKADVHYGRATSILDRRHRTRTAAYAAHPERFVQGPPRLEILPHAVWINPPMKSTAQDAPGSTIVTPNDPQHGGINESHVSPEHQSTALTCTVELLQ
jgi:hypothetical protein